MTDYKDGYSHIIVRLERDSDGYPDAETERLWGKPVGPGLFQVENIPFYAKGISAGDVVEAKELSPGVYEFAKVVKRSGRSTFRIFLGDEIPNKSVVLKELIETLNSMGCSTEGLSRNSTLTAIDVPPAADVDAVADLLHRKYKLGVLDYEEALVPPSFVSRKHD